MKDWKIKTVKIKGPNFGKKYAKIKKGGYEICVFRHSMDVFLFHFVDECGDFTEECYENDVTNMLRGFGERVEVNFPNLVPYLDCLEDVNVDHDF